MEGLLSSRSANGLSLSLSFKLVGQLKVGLWDRSAVVSLILQPMLKLCSCY